MKTLDKICLSSYMVSLALLLVMRDVGGASISKWLFVLVAAALMFIGNLPSVVYMTAFTIPLLCGIPNTYVMLVAFALMVFKLGKVNAYTISMSALMLILEFFASIWYPNSDLVGMVSYMVHIAALFLLMSEDILKNQKIDSKLVVQFYLFGSVLLCSVIIITGLKTAPANWLELYAKGHFRFGSTHTDANTGMALTLNANNLGYYSTVGCFTAFQMIRKGHFGLLNAAICSIHLLAGILAVSRTFMILGAACLLLMMLCSAKSVKWMCGVAFVVAMVVTGFAVLQAKYPDLIMGWTTRLADENMATGNGRIDLLVQYLLAWLENPRCIIMGSGVVGYKSILNVYNSLHNALEQILVCYGVVGSAIFLYGMIRPLVMIRWARCVQFLDWIPYLSLVLFIQTIQFVDPTMLMMPYAIVVHAITISNRTRKMKVTNICR